MKKEIIDIALDEFGTREIVGQQDNPEVLKYFDGTGFDGRTLKDETAWCAAFVNWVLQKAGFQGSGKLNARSFLEVGEATESPEKGDIVVLWRNSPDDWRGHVGFYVRESQDHIYVLGGNQGNEVSIKKYPKSRLLQYRMPC
ncbi:TIGR02594 family protein [Allomuricauda sp. M10]|uniref:TIGR02594 family protein n=1 Tax=Allomuricauda sp. M10 TaxID=2683292 RepID=UPI001D183ED9|nr:TIGR02594 family protein [Muricauda sp. M10]